MSEENNEKVNTGKGKKVAKIIGNVLFYSVIGIVLVFGIIALIGKAQGKNSTLKLFGYTFYVVGSSSMTYVNEEYADFLEGHDDRIRYDAQKRIGDLIITKTIPDGYELKVYDVVTFLDSDGRTIVHRIVEIEEMDDGALLYRTRGDSNNTDDGLRSRDKFTGILVRNAGMGWSQAIKFIQSGYGIAAVFGTIGIILTAVLVSMVIDDKAKKKKALAAQNDDEPTATTAGSADTTANSSPATNSAPSTPPSLEDEFKDW